MPQINHNKGYEQIPLRVKLSEDIEIPDNWLNKLANFIKQYLDLEAEQKQEISKLMDNLNRHAGPDSAYQLKDQLHESLKIIYQTFVDPASSSDQKITLALKLQEGLPNCTEGFHGRVNELVISLFEPENLNELLVSMRQGIVSKAAAAMTDEVHAYNRFFVIALVMGYGVRPLNPFDKYIGNIPVETIQDILIEIFTKEYTFFSVLNFLREQLTEIFRKKGYIGRLTDGYGFADYQKFGDTLTKFFAVANDPEQLFIFDDDYKIIDININWCDALIKIFIQEKYFILSPAEEKQIDSLLNLNNKFISRDSLSLFQGPEDFIHALNFFKEWPADKKANLILFFLQNSSQQDHKLFLEEVEITLRNNKHESLNNFMSMPLALSRIDLLYLLHSVLTHELADSQIAKGLIFNLTGLNFDWKESKKIVRTLTPQDHTALLTIAESLKITNPCYISQINGETAGFVKDFKGNWYPVKILESQGSQIKIHYQGWADKWDEWIDKNSDRLSAIETINTFKKFCTDNPELPQEWQMVGYFAGLGNNEIALRLFQVLLAENIINDDVNQYEEKLSSNNPLSVTLTNKIVNFAINDDNSSFLHELIIKFDISVNNEWVKLAFEIEKTKCLDDIVDDGKCVCRSLKLGVNKSFYPVDLSKRSGLGFDFAIYSVLRVRPTLCSGGPPGWSPRPGTFENLCRKKIENLDNLCHHGVCTARVASAGA